MTTEEKEKVKKLLEDVGFEIIFHHSTLDGVESLMLRPKKDEWEGVKYAEYTHNASSCYTKGKIYPIKKIEGNMIYTKFDNDLSEDNGSVKQYFKPSTEQAYKDQLIKEAKERYGEIKEGDQFKSVLDGSDVIAIDMRYNWDYDSEIDRLFYRGICFYFKGKWAERLPDHIKIDCYYKDSNGVADIKLVFPFSIKAAEIGLENIAFMLEKTLEEYLNSQ